MKIEKKQRLQSVTNKNKQTKKTEKNKGKTVCVIHINTQNSVSYVHLFNLCRLLSQFRMWSSLFSLVLVT